ncbi:MAG: DUF2851 family protein [Bacteroidetes bacterium]|nr:DUF2851 family protein [Bacteroidota bacterium]
MTEDFLHYVWKYKLFDANQLATTDGLPVEVKSYGIHNSDSGPDFANAQIKIGDTLWAGNVEIHLRTSDWNRHRHQFDAAYTNVILHVVFENDTKLQNQIPVLELNKCIKPTLLATYEQMMNTKSGLPCEKQLHLVKPITVTTWLDRMLTSRLEEKTQHIEELLTQTNNHWEQTFYITLARCFGFKTNALPFELLARQTPVELLAKQKDNLLQLEALLLGQAGLLDTASNDAYEKSLVREYNFLQAKFKLTPVNGSLWKFARMRPANFPTVRLAQFAMLVHKSSGLWSKVLEAKNYKSLCSLFDINASGYWDTHYHFAVDSKLLPKHIGKMRWIFYL